MTKTKDIGTCPICLKRLQGVAKHLREFHRVHNPKEREILNNMASGRVRLGGGVCPLVPCNTFVLHLEKHLQAHDDATQRL